MTEPNYRREFARSPHHIWLAILTLGLGLLSVEFLGLILGVTGYTLGWIYLPDMPFFKKWLRRRSEGAERKKALEEMVSFVRRRDAQLGRLSPVRRERYDDLVTVCRDIERATTDGTDGAGETRARKLEELMW
ncbi:MAG: hypothetical protein MUE60_15410, partial [Candidatus Eisenbacteria bacterium]|nr:hypothetical protein [Candidatus Eisenbacteria bacterium]